MDKTFGNIIEKRAKNYANEECHCYKCDGVDNFTHNDCKLSLEEGCQEHRWKEMGYKQGAKDQLDIDIKKMCDYMCNICKNNSTDGPFECTSEEKEMCSILNIKKIKSYMLYGGIDMNFNSQICTTREQSEHLLVLGLKKETADMCWTIDERDNIVIGLIDRTVEYIVPAWSLHRLWELLSKIKKYEGEDELMYPRIFIEEDDVILVNPKSIWVRRNFCSPKGVYENIINCIEELIKEGNFNKEYLV